MDIWSFIGLVFVSIAVVVLSTRWEKRLQARATKGMEQFAARMSMQGVSSLLEAGLDSRLRSKRLRVGFHALSKLFPIDQRFTDLETPQNVVHGRHANHDVICCTLTVVEQKRMDSPATAFMSRVTAPVPDLRVFPVKPWSRPLGSPSPMGREFDRIYGTDGQTSPASFAQDFAELTRYLVSHPGWDAHFFASEGWVVALRDPAPPPEKLPGLLQDFTSMLERLPGERQPVKPDPVPPEGPLPLEPLP